MHVLGVFGRCDDPPDQITNLVVDNLSNDDIRVGCMCGLAKWVGRIFMHVCGYHFKLL